LKKKKKKKKKFEKVKKKKKSKIIAKLPALMPGSWQIIVSPSVMVRH